MRQRALRNYGGGLRPANWAFGRRVHRRDRPETPWSRQVLRGSSSTKVPGLIPAAPESYLSPEPVYRCQKPDYQSSVASVAVRQTLNVVFLNQLSAKFFLIGRCFISHVKDLIAGANVLLGIAVTVDAPVHVERIFFVHQGHLVDAAMAGGASDAFVDVHAVVEVHEIGQIVDTAPLERLAGAITGAYRLQDLGVRPDLRMTAREDLGGGKG